jgi:hypothetical protein
MNRLITFQYVVLLLSIVSHASTGFSMLGQTSERSKSRWLSSTAQAFRCSKYSCDERLVDRTQLSVAARFTTDHDHDDRTHTYFMSVDDINPIVKFGKENKTKVINAFGLWCALVSIVTGSIWSLSMSILQFWNEQYPDWDKNHEIYDSTGKVWSKVWLSLTDCYPTISGNVDALTSEYHDGPCLYVANHASWLDIPLLCTILDPVFKFIAKGELKNVPCIGQQLIGVSCTHVVFVCSDS